MKKFFIAMIRTSWSVGGGRREGGRLCTVNVVSGRYVGIRDVITRGYLMWPKCIAILLWMSGISHGHYKWKHLFIFYCNCKNNLFPLFKFSHPFEI